MNIVVERLIYRRPGKHHNFLMHPFLLMTLSYGIALVFFTHTGPVAGTVLYKLTVAHFGSDVVSLWGASAIAITVINTIGMLVRKRWLGTWVSIAGFMLWTYAFVLYATGGFWLQVFYAAIPNMMFWAWYYMTIIKYHDYEDDDGNPPSLD